ncbi:hypothetical protein BH10PAT1_BH10PAT1_6670 [soil metagenome]
MITGEIDNKSQLIEENKNYTVMLVNAPQTRGHFIIFPKKHYSELSEFKNTGLFFEYSINMAEKIIKKLNAKAYVMKLNNKVFMLDDNPMHVGHIHCHIIPIYSDKDLSSKPKFIDKDKLIALRDLLLDKK